jgi:hypothetical protein
MTGEGLSFRLFWYVLHPSKSICKYKLLLALQTVVILFVPTRHNHAALITLHFLLPKRLHLRCVLLQLTAAS